MLDRTYLEPAILEIAVVADTHFFHDPDNRPVEFASRRQQSARAERALREIAALAPDIVVHLGDLAQAVPEGAEFVATQDQAVAQLARCGVRPYHVAGNQDVGDKPDPTMPTDWVTRASLDAYQRRFGRSWYSFPAADRHCIVLNSQIMNGALPEAAEQRHWLEAELAAHAAQRLLVFTHLPLFLRDEDEPHLGHYDNWGQPDRAWLVALIRRYSVELVLVGHSHWSFFNRISATRYHVAPSTSHTRPGFSELFSSGPPPEQGRDDAAKLGFLLVRLHPDRPRVHLIRTSGETALPTATEGQRLLTRHPSDLPHGRLGVTLTHPLAPAVELPLAWPSAIRQPVRNDYPLLTCLELGARHLRVPLHDLRDRAQRDRLAAIRDEGVDLTVSWLCVGESSDFEAIAACSDLLAGVELQIPGSPWPTAAVCAAIQRIQRDHQLPITLTALVPNQLVPGKQLRRTRIGYLPEELAELDRLLTAADLTVERVLCRLASGVDHATRPAMPPTRYRSIGALDWAYDPGAHDDASLLERLALVLWATAATPEARLYVEPLLDLDRTMDASFGLLDRQCNPRPALQALRCLNTVLFRQSTVPQRLSVPILLGLHLFGLQLEDARAWLALPSGNTTTPPILASAALAVPPEQLGHGRVIDLSVGRSHPLAETILVDRPLLITVADDRTS